MNHHIRSMQRLAPLAMTGAVLWFVGCAPAYHCYSGCHVNCRYCPPAPLAHTFYDPNVCHSWPAAKYLSSQPSAAPQQAPPSEEVSTRLEP